jgi:acyl-CoA dehydrogenase
MQFLQFSGLLTELPPGIATLGVIVAFSWLAYKGAPAWLWALVTAILLFGIGVESSFAWFLWAAGAILFTLPLARRIFVTPGIMSLFKALNFLPAISNTERTAIEAGNTWVDGELFSGKPDWARLMNEAYPELNEEEQAFLDGPVEELCRITNDWQVYQNRALPKEAWKLIKKEKFFGLIIPKEYGGRGFTPSANSAAVVKLMSRCGPLGTTVMVPNSLGPAELLVHYGTKAQKDHYLPKLAKGEEIPCFALTEPGAGSDAGSMTSEGEVFRGEDGELYIRLNWNKRYITLAAISTVLGLAFKLRDPDNLLGKREYPGITCALIPTETPGVILGKRHDPLTVPFYNCPTEGKDVIVPIDAIIGGAEQAGNGWRMLMESLATGRGISLPAASVGGAKLTARVAGAYARIRRQFGLSIGKFEGIEEPLARIAGYTYIMEAARRYTLGGLDTGQKPSVITAVAKYNLTELLRKIINDGMDVVGGAGIVRGPRNLLAHTYFGTPINITVEGANILTRTLMIFGQGVIRSHRYAYNEITALTQGDVKTFDKAFWAHVSHVVRNLFRTVLLSLTRGHISGAHVEGPTATYFRRLNWAAASFALLADITMALYGGNLKRMEKVSGRFADVFSGLYLGTATLRRFEAEGSLEEDLPFLNWSMEYVLTQIQQAFDGLYRNMGWFFRVPIAFWSQLNSLASPPSDSLGSAIAQALQKPGAQRDRITGGIYIPEAKEEALGRIEYTLKRVDEANRIVKTLKDAVRNGELEKAGLATLAENGVKAGIITEEDARLFAEAEAARADAIQVDSFTQEEYLNGSRGGWPKPKVNVIKADKVAFANGHKKSEAVGQPDSK